MTTTSARMYQRRRTAAQFAAENPILGPGEIGVVTAGGGNNPGLLIGDGTTAFNSLTGIHVPGVITTDHDALYAWPMDMQSNGTLLELSPTTDTGVPRWSLADGVTQRVKGIVHMLNGTSKYAFRWGWSNESVNAGNVNWILAYRIVKIGSEGDVNAGAVTTLATQTIAAPAQYDLLYSLPSAYAAIDLDIAGSPFGAFFLWSLSRDGLADSLTGAASVIVTTFTRVP